MKRLIAIFGSIMLGTFIGGGALSSASADGVHFGINIGVPVPAPVVVAPAPVVVAPPPAVVGVPVYFYGAQYYTFYNGAWFVGPGYTGPWNYVAVAHVPRPVVVLPHAHGRWHGHDGAWRGHDGHPGRGPREHERHGR